MGIDRKHIVGVTGTTLALVLAGATVVAAHGGPADREGRAFGGGGILRGELGRGFPGLGARLAPMFGLANGETATVSADEDTEVLAAMDASDDDAPGPFRRAITLDEIALADVPADADVTVWSEAGDSGEFVAQRVIVHPTDDATAESAGDADTTEAPAASPDA